MEYCIQKGGETSKCKYPTSMYSATALEWVSPQGVRIPEAVTKEIPEMLPFTAAGKPYKNRTQLCATVDETRKCCRDIYGREVWCLSERFPCFDSEDYLHEKRHYRWYLIIENGKMTRIFYADKQQTMTVTEDVRFLEDKCWEALRDWGLLG